jgi:hypothetical protein
VPHWKHGNLGRSPCQEVAIVVVAGTAPDWKHRCVGPPQQVVTLIIVTVIIIVVAMVCTLVVRILHSLAV